MTTTDKTKILEADEVNDEYSKIKFIGHFSMFIELHCTPLKKLNRYKRLFRNGY